MVGEKQKKEKQASENKKKEKKPYTKPVLKEHDKLFKIGIGD